jgi:F420-0:gamma-glutamyl ligase
MYLKKLPGGKAVRAFGTVVRGVRCPVIRQGDDLKKIVVESVCSAVNGNGIEFNDRDIVAVTEAVVARAQGNYATVDQIAEDIKNKFQCDTIGVVFPILSRNRFAVCLRAMARAMKKITLLLSYPADEVGNHLFPEELLENKDINPWTDVLDENKYRELFGFSRHEFTGVDYAEYYKEVIISENCEAEVIFANNPLTILDYCDSVMTCDIHTRKRSRKRLVNAGVKKVFGLDEILCESVNGSGYNEKYGLLGSNKASENEIKLFPRDSQNFVDSLQKTFCDRTGKKIEVMVYGDGAFKDPQGKIWELADPVVSPAYTEGLAGTPSEIKLKYLADNDFKDLCGAELEDAIRDCISKKDTDLVGSMASQGTTPRRITDLLGSLCDLTSGSGDKGTPIVFIQGYFDNFSS